jgi:hypothetical protein
VFYFFRTVGEAALGTDATLGTGIIGITIVVVLTVVVVVVTGQTDGGHVLVIVTVEAAQGLTIGTDAVNNFAQASHSSLMMTVRLNFQN